MCHSSENVRGVRKGSYLVQEENKLPELEVGEEVEEDMGKDRMDGAPRGRGSEGEGCGGRHRRGGFAGMVPSPPPMQTQIQRMGGMSSAVIGGFCEHSPVVHELVVKFADMTAK
jgi:hypothetical protein